MISNYQSQTYPFFQEVPENGADLAHLPQVHSPFLLDSSHLRDMWNGFWSFIRHDWSGTWAVLDESTPHIGTLTLHHCVKVFGYPLDILNTDVIAEQVGNSDSQYIQTR